MTLVLKSKSLWRMPKHVPEESRGDYEGLVHGQVIPKQLIPGELFNHWKYLFASPGYTISPKRGERWMAFVGLVTINSMRGGYVYATNTTVLYNYDQAEGSCFGYYRSVIYNYNQSGGVCRGFNSCTIYNRNQIGGQCSGSDQTVLHNWNQTGGSCSGTTLYQHTSSNVGDS